MNDCPDSVKKFQGFEENMKRLYGEIDRMVYAAEQACPKTIEERYQCKEQGCTFLHADHLIPCQVVFLRGTIGDHVEQHDPTGAQQ